MANTDDENLSELLDDDKFDGMQVPPDRPLGVTDREVDRDEDSVEERARREIPDRLPSDHSHDVGALIDPTPDYDDESDAIASDVRIDRDRMGRDLSIQDLEEVQSAEEAAMHITEDPPFDTADDGYVEE